MNPDRRMILQSASFSLAGVALSYLNSRIQGAPLPGIGTGKKARVKRIVQITLVGGLSHLDSFDYKPGLRSRHGKSFKSDKPPDIFFGQIGLLRQNDWEFRQRGKSGLWMSELFPAIAGLADNLTVIRSMVAESANHTPALFFENSGFGSNGFPALGSWISHGLGAENENLPVFVVLPDGRGEANGCASNWTSGFLPPGHQGVVLRAGKEPVRDLLRPESISKESDSASRDFLSRLNQENLQRSGFEKELVGRIRAHELAAKLQTSVPEVSSLAGETQETLELYGVDKDETRDCAQRCLLARRLLERGVRFVQIYSGGPIGGNPRSSWDAHENVKENHTVEAGKIDRPVAALLADLKRRGLLEDTLVLFTTEFGRTPFAQSAAGTVGAGRDHNKYGFSIWMAGAGLKAGFAFGQTDEIGWKAEENPVPWHDLHATILHLLGIDHEKLTYYHNGIQRRLTNVHGHIVEGILA
ncbi:MAG: DUF1501 domain-containing protein [Gemmataceae bacterium]|nr:DUF1501 domain-containing protein [Gemmataceae bacterium]